MSTWVYKRTEQSLWTVGYYAPDGEWNTDSDHGSPDEAAKRASLLNGSAAELMNQLQSALEDEREKYQLLVEHIIDKLNPRDGDEAEVALCMEAIDKVVAFVEPHRCVCALDAPETGEHICPRCDALGRVCDRQVER